MIHFKGKNEKQGVRCILPALGGGDERGGDLC